MFAGKQEAMKNSGPDKANAPMAGELFAGENRPGDIFLFDEKNKVLKRIADGPGLARKRPLFLYQK